MLTPPTLNVMTNTSNEFGTKAESVACAEKIRKKKPTLNQIIEGLG